jgi:hAT family C-terminal dimerisation region
LNKQAQTEKEEAFRTMGVLGKLHNINIHTRSSASRTKEFRSLAGRMIPLDNSTRWNSWYQMVDIALQKESAIDNYIKANFKSLEKDHLSPQDWKTLRTIYSFLQPFNRATLEAQGDHITLDQLLFTMDVLSKHMKKSLVQHRTNKDMTYRIQQAVKKFDDYYRKTDNSPLYAAALILHPNRRTKYAKIWWKKDYQKVILPKVKDLWIKYQDSAYPINIVSYEIPDTAAPKELDEFDRIVNEINERITRPASQDEYEDYCSEAPYEIQKPPLQWWCEEPQRKRWPRLSMFAIEILSIPAMSDEPERVFSGGRRTMSWERMQLGISSLEHTECMKSWHRSGILIEED